jgi:hypothetical protein
LFRLIGPVELAGTQAIRVRETAGRERPVRLSERRIDGAVLVNVSQHCQSINFTSSIETDIDGEFAKLGPKGLREAHPHLPLSDLGAHGRSGSPGPSP